MCIQPTIGHGSRLPGRRRFIDVGTDKLGIKGKKLKKWSRIHKDIMHSACTGSA